MKSRPSDWCLGSWGKRRSVRSEIVKGGLTRKWELNPLVEDWGLRQGKGYMQGPWEQSSWEHAEKTEWNLSSRWIKVFQMEINIWNFKETILEFGKMFSLYSEKSQIKNYVWCFLKVKKKKKIDPVYYVGFYVLDINLHNRPKLYFHIIFDIKFHIQIVWPLKKL